MIDLGEVTIGGQSAELWQRAVKGAGCLAGNYAKAILNEATVFVPQRTSLSLVAVSNEELKSGSRLRWDESFALAQAAGLRVVSPEAGPALRIKIADRAEHRDKILTIAMMPVRTKASHDLRMLTVECNGVDIPWLSTMPAFAGAKEGEPHDSEIIWVFAT